MTVCTFMDQFLCVCVCVCRDAEGASEERASTTGGSLLCPQHHGGGQTTSNQGRIRIKYIKHVHMQCACWLCNNDRKEYTLLEKPVSQFASQVPHIPLSHTGTAVCHNGSLPLLSRGGSRQKKIV